jgi:putative ABC transport system permease protein
MRSLSRDIRYEVRQLFAARAFTATAVLTLSLGIGCTTAIYSVVEGVLLRPLPFADPHNLVQLGDIVDGNDSEDPSLPAAESILLTRNTHSFQSLGAYQLLNYELSGPIDAAQIAASRLNASVFSTLGVPPLMGRVFTPEEDAGRAQVAVLSYQTWRGRFHGAAQILGSRIQLDRKPYVVIGVMPRGFEFPLAPGQLNRTEVWVPASITRSELESGSGSWGFGMVARLKPGVTPGQAQQDAGGVSAREIRRSYRWHTVVRRLDSATTDAARPLMRTLALAAAVVLFIACSNFAGLLLVRATLRQQEFAVRLALGAPWVAILRQNLAASLVLSLSGGLLGLGLAMLSLRLGIPFLPETMPRVGSIHIDGSVIGFAILLATLTGIACGLVPAMATRRKNLLGSLKEGRTTTSRGGHARLRSTLVVAELGITLVLVAAAGLLLRSFQKMIAVDMGFRIDHVLTAAYALPLQQYSTQAAVDAFDDALVTKLQNLPGAVAVGVTMLLPGTAGPNLGWGFVPENSALADGKRLSELWGTEVFGNYFAAQGIPVIRGRVFTSADRADSPLVVVVNRTLAQRYWPGQDPIGKRIHFGGKSTAVPWLTIVGEIGDIRQGAADQDTEPQCYQPASQFLRSFAGYMPADTLTGDGGVIILRSTLPPEQMTGSLRAVVRSLDPQLPLTQLQSMERAVDDGREPRRFTAALVSAFAMIAVVLAALGVYSVIAFSAASRRREMAIRLALGSSRSGVMRLILLFGARLGFTGCLLGAAVALFATRLMRSLLFQVDPLDPPVLVLAAVSVLVLTVLACLIPARQAASNEPMEILRME